MKDHEYFLTPVQVQQPPHHTIIHPRCFTCSKFPVCRIREDYLKTAELIQQLLGNPQEDRAIGCFNPNKPTHPTGYMGHSFAYPETIFLKEISTSIAGVDGQFVDAKWRVLDFVQFIYNINGYYVLFSALWNKNMKYYNIKEGREIYYGVPVEMSDFSKKEIAANLKTWRQETKDEIEESQADIINTTAFSAKLECQFYEHEKGLTEEEGIRRIVAQFPHGVPCKDGSYYHLATYHIEPNKVPLYHPQNGKTAFMPMPYPVFVPKPCKPKPKPPKRREDIRKCDCD